MTSPHGVLRLPRFAPPSTTPQGPREAPSPVPTASTWDRSGPTVRPTATCRSSPRQRSSWASSGRRHPLRRPHRPAGADQPAHRQRLPHRARRGDDLRHPHRGHRPLGRLGGRPVDDDRRQDRRHGLVALPVRSSPCWRPARCSGCRWSAASTTSTSSRFIATLAGLFLPAASTYLISVESISIKDPTFTELAFRTVWIGDYYDPLDRDHRRWLAVAVAAYVLARTGFGRTVYAIGGNESSAMLMGLGWPSRRSASTSSAASARRSRSPVLASTSLSVEQPPRDRHAVDAIAAVVIGGTLLTVWSRYVLGSLLGALLGMIKTLDRLRRHPQLLLDPDRHRPAVLAFVVVQRFATRRGHDRDRADAGAAAGAAAGTPVMAYVARWPGCPTRPSRA